MGKVILSMSISLDGYATGPNSGFEFPLGEGGMRLFENLGAEPIELERLRVAASPVGTHFWFRVVKA